MSAPTLRRPLLRRRRRRAAERPLPSLPSSRLPLADALRLGAHGLRTRRARTALSAIGIAIGVAAMVAVLGVAESSRTRVLDQLAQLGTNLLTVSPGDSFFGEEVTLPETAAPAVRGMPGVERAAATTSIAAGVRRTDRIPEQETGGIELLAAEPSLLATVGGRLAAGRFLDAALDRYPAVVLGSLAAKRLGIARPGPRIHAGGRWLTVVGIMRPVPLVSALDRAALIGYPVAERLYGTSRSPTSLHVRTDEEAVVATRELIPATAYPQRPEEVAITRPSDALAAKAATEDALTALLLGLGAVALLVGGIGIANVMVIAVLERRREIGLRRALGATRRHVAVQFLCEALLLSSLGGALGVLLGAAGTVAYAASQDVRAVVPAIAIGGGLLASLAMGAVAGLYPALRATRLSPTEALRST
ncbi:ABC transporter permease [Conexibacter arvalis]|uniref:Putative ABC transport system permease protein n=1 Tax=Conexibacter arvalis TaxID=912552 RepID=A0A840I989_9ACTN|nr:ABC transporter permease [Conexibacter arvalis]MBB4660831.1 putative ABC transport system permease protein [Conexibacter arvalis]